MNKKLLKKYTKVGLPTNPRKKSEPEPEYNKKVRTYHYIPIHKVDREILEQCCDDFELVFDKN
jgi:hypothetical protein